MKVKVSQFIADFLANKGVEHVFTVTGGGAMHLNDAFGHHKDLKCIYNHHEQACAIAAEGYARYCGKVAAVVVTSGPGGTNAITGVIGGWLDSIPMFVISGQVKRETTIHATDLPLRGLGDQEFDITGSVKNMTKYAEIILDPTRIRYCMEKAWYLCNNGRKGPVWLDVPLDIQASWVETDDLQGFEPAEKEKPEYDGALTAEIIKRIAAARRPAILVGTGLRLSEARDEFIKMVDKLKIPVLTAWNAHDVIWDEHPCYCGRPGSVGTRGGNFITQNCDLLLVIGCRLNIRQISYNYKVFAQNAVKIVVDIDKYELQKPTIKVDVPVWADAKDFVDSVLASKESAGRHDDWLKWCRDLNQKYPAALPEYFKSKRLNPYAFFDDFTGKLKNDDAIICGNGSACVITFQAARLKQGQRLFTNSGCAAMGYGFPAAIGVCVSRNGKRTICIDGDGSFQMNLQELQTVVYNKLNLKIIYINNNGYHSIRQTQTNLFKGALIGVCDGNGLSFPEAEKLAWAYGIPYMKVDALDQMDRLMEFIETDGPAFCEIIVDPTQNFEPKLSSKILPDGKIVSPEIDDMFPFLPREEYDNYHNCKI